MSPQASLRLGVILTEILLTVSLIGWMRSSLRGKPTPWPFILKILFYGALAALVASFVTLRYSFDLTALQKTNPDLVARWGPLMSFLNITSGSLIEELAKYTIGVFILVTGTYGRRLSDTIVALIIVGLGFSLVEDLLYLANPLTVPAYRLLSFYVHSGTSAIIGYSLGRFRFGLAGYRELFRAIVTAIFLHATFNLATQMQNQHVALYLTIGLTVVISLQIFILFRKTLNEEYEYEATQRPRQKPTRLLNLKPA